MKSHNKWITIIIGILIYQDITTFIMVSNHHQYETFGNRVGNF